MQKSYFNLYLLETEPQAPAIEVNIFEHKHATVIPGWAGKNKMNQTSFQ